VDKKSWKFTKRHWKWFQKEGGASKKGRGQPIQELTRGGDQVVRALKRVPNRSPKNKWVVSVKAGCQTRGRGKEATRQKGKEGLICGERNKHKKEGEEGGEKESSNQGEGLRHGATGIRLNFPTRESDQQTPGKSAKRKKFRNEWAIGNLETPMGGVSRSDMVTRSCINKDGTNFNFWGEQEEKRQKD